MTDEASEIVLSKQDLRGVSAFAAACAEVVLGIFEADQPDDSRPRQAVGAAREFARGGERGKSLRDTASAALKAAGSAGTAAAREAAWAAMSAAGAAYLHPLAKATQVKHILGAAAYAARAAELVAGDDRSVAPNTFGERCNARTRSSSTCSGVFPPRRLAVDGLVS
ncbi:putative immunity protein [Streptomyces sp. NPDC101206]|uniref:putative immunity protein n=1 Tax=Streptomyces sp. NPDC101206 TaxID=3366128 RepID=UPI00381CC4D7